MAHMNESRIQWVILDVNESCRICVTHSYVTWLSYTWHDSVICEITHSCVTRLMYVRHHLFMCDMTYSYVTWLIHTWFMLNVNISIRHLLEPTHIWKRYVTHGWTYQLVMSHIYGSSHTLMSHVKHSQISIRDLLGRTHTPGVYLYVVHTYVCTFVYVFVYAYVCKYAYRCKRIRLCVCVCVGHALGVSLVYMNM